MYDNTACDVDVAVNQMAQRPEIGVRKIGDLSERRVELIE